MSILMALLPALAWGSIALIVSKINGSPANQIFGMSIGAALMGVLVLLISGETVTGWHFFFAMVSGAAWTVGQIGQFTAFKRIGVTQTMPISTGLQLVGNSLIGVLIFGEWNSSFGRILGAIALAMIIFGVFLTTQTGEKDQKAIHSSDWLLLIGTTIGYWIYSSFPKVFVGSSTALLFPQTLGIFVGTMLYIVFFGNAKVARQKESWLSIIAGILFGVGALTYIYSADANGVATAFVFSQLNVVISTLGGMYILGEKRQGKALSNIFIGLLVIILGSILTAFI